MRKGTKKEFILDESTAGLNNTPKMTEMPIEGRIILLRKLIHVNIAVIHDLSLNAFTAEVRKVTKFTVMFNIGFMKRTISLYAQYMTKERGFFKVNAIHFDDPLSIITKFI